MSEKSKLDEQLQDKPYREAFVFSQMSIPISFQIRALREQRGLTQKQLAEKADMLQPRIVELERPKGKEPNLRTLGRLAAAFDVALIVRFAPFSELVEWADNFSPDTFVVPSFEDDQRFQKSVTGSADIQTTVEKANNPLLPRVFQPYTFHPETKINSYSSVNVTYDNTVNLPGSHLTITAKRDKIRNGVLIQSQLDGHLSLQR